MTTEQRLQIIEGTFKHLTRRAFRREMSELIAELELTVGYSDTTRRRLLLFRDMFRFQTFAQLQGERHEVRELITEMRFVHKNKGAPEVYHRFDGCDKSPREGVDRALGTGTELRRCSNAYCACTNPDCDNKSYCQCH